MEKSKSFNPYGVTLEEVINEIGDIVCVCNDTPRFLWVSDSYSKLTGKPIEDIIGANPEELFPDFKNSVFYEAFSSTKTHKKPTFRVGYSNLVNKYLVVRCKYIESSGLYMVYASVMTEDQTKAGYVASYDQITSLPNKYSLELDLDKIYSDVPEYTAIMFDVEKFKKINAEFGNEAGDMVIAEMAARLRLAAKGNNVKVYKGNSDQFIAIANCDPKAALEVATALKNTFNQSFSVKGNLVNFNVKVVASPEKMTKKLQGSELLRKLEITMQVAKLSGKRFLAYSSELEEKFIESFNLETKIKEAFAKNKFTLMYQPQIQLSTKKTTGIEALIRWIDDDLGFVSPAEFLPVIQKLGLNKKLDLYVMDRCMALAGRLQKSYHVEVSINITTDSLCDKDFPKKALERAKQLKLINSLICFEVTESGMIVQPDTAVSVMNELKSYGFKTAIDDFGTGYSSMSYLANYPVEKLKIDKSFVDNIETEANKRIVLSNIIKLAHALGMQTVIEGVESKEQFDFVKKAQGDIIQGYYYSKPIKLEELGLFLKQNGISFENTAIG